MEKDKELYDFSEYPIGHFLQNNDNKKKIGKFKDELKGKTLEEFCGLRAKCYLILLIAPKRIARVQSSL